MQAIGYHLLKLPREMWAMDNYFKVIHHAISSCWKCMTGPRERNREGKGTLDQSRQAQHLAVNRGEASKGRWPGRIVGDQDSVYSGVT